MLARCLCTLTMVALMCPMAGADVAKPRPRELGVPFQGHPGELNAITDVPGVEVGQLTLNSGEGAHPIGAGPIRTGVTAVFPRGKDDLDSVFAATFALNGVGELTGKSLIDEYGEFVGPVVTTGTGSVGVVRDAVIEWYRDRLKPSAGQFFPYLIPVVGETYGGNLNDLLGFHITAAHTIEALNSARTGPVEEGNVGGGTGMVCFFFAGGIGTASRVLPPEQGGYTVGVLVQANFGDRQQLTIAGVPVGRHLADELQPIRRPPVDGSIIITIATDAPLLPHQLARVARRASHGVARTGGLSSNMSGDMFIAFSNAKLSKPERGIVTHGFVDSGFLDPIFNATVFATEEAIINALFAANDMTGVNGNKVFALPHDRVLELLEQYNRLGPAR